MKVLLSLCFGLLFAVLFSQETEPLDKKIELVSSVNEMHYTMLIKEPEAIYNTKNSVKGLLNPEWYKNMPMRKPNSEGFIVPKLKRNIPLKKKEDHSTEISK